MPKSSHLQIGDGLYDKGCWLRDPQISMSGLGLFRVAFGQRNAPAPTNNVQELDVEKLVVLGVFMDIDLLTQIAKNYDPITRIVRNISGGPLVEITANEVKRVFRLNEASSYLEPIDFEMLRKVYDAQKDHLRSGPMREFFAKIGGLTLVGPSTVEPFPMNLFTLRAKGIYWSLCQFFGEDLENVMPTHYMLMMTQILNSSIAVAYEFAPYLANVIHEGLIGINNAKGDGPFG